MPRALEMPGGDKVPGAEGTQVGDTGAEVGDTGGEQVGDTGG